jgi:C4-dicarboxylate-specific signal transduction histidine kinase
MDLHLEKWKKRKLDAGLLLLILVATASLCLSSDFRPLSLGLATLIHLTLALLLKSLYKKQELQANEIRAFQLALVQLKEESSLSNRKIQDATKLIALGQMTGRIAHEINNPLTVIYSRAKQIQRTLAKDHTNIQTVLKMASVIEDMALRMETIVKNLRSMSRQEKAGEFQMADAKDILRNTIILCEERFRSQGVELRMTLPEEELPISCHSIPISQVLLNLLNNAFDAVKDLPSPWVELDAHAELDTILLRVSDSGPGIPEPLRQKIMTPYFTTKVEGEGTGLGLSISAQIIAEHGGRLYLDEQRLNTSFVIALPRNETADYQSKKARA